MENFPPNFVGCFLKLHNQYRAIHKSPPLELDEKLSEYAQEWAEILAKRGVLAYRPDTKYGENIYVSFWRNVPQKINPKDPIESWYREGKYFKYGDAGPKNLKDVRHFTQLLWKETKTIGLGMAVGSDRKIYLVCNYHPRGNIDGEFTSNVLPSGQDGELLRHEAEGIRTIETRMDVVRSMERLYAVPSEKLRVWSVWLTKIGEIADEWQKWLRAHIDLTVRLSDHLQAAEDAIRRSREEEEKLKQGLSGEDDETKKLDGVGDSARGDQGVVETADDEETQVREIFTAEEAATKSEVHIDKPTEEETVESPEKSAGETEDAQEAATSEVDHEEPQEKSDDTLTPEMKEEILMTWPIGQPWKHSGAPKKAEREIESLPLPTNEEEMRQFVKEFTHQATIYRSYYKHWNETADQAIKEIGGRLVLATYKVRGEGDPEPKKRLGLQASRYLSASNGKSRSKKGISESKTKGIDRSSPAESVPEPSMESSERESVKSADSSDQYFTPDASRSDAPTIIENAPGPSPTNPVGPSNGTAKQPLKVQSSTHTVGVDDWVRDNARAAEPIPYFFYLKAEPDIEIAIEHDDEEVIAADPDRESVVGNYTRLFYNLADKPFKQEKPIDYNKHQNTK